MDLSERLLWALGILGGVGAVVIADDAYEKLATGIPTLDRFAIRGRVLFYSAMAGVDPKVIMGILHQESKGDPDNFLGDVDASGGPSVGPGQVYRVTAKELGLWRVPEGLSEEDERAAYANMAEDLDWGIKSAIAVYKDKLKHASGDRALAISLYNGNPSLARVQTYRSEVLGFITTTYGAV